MGFIQSALKAIRFGEAEINAKIKEWHQNRSIQISQQDIDDAQAELNVLTTKTGAFDGYIKGLEDDVDGLVDQKAQLETERNQYVDLLKLAGQGENQDKAQIDQYRIVAKQTMSELAKVTEDLTAKNTELEEARVDYEALMDQIGEIADFIEGQEKDLESDKRQLDMARVQRTAAEMGNKLGAADGDSPIARLKESTLLRKQKVNETIGYARTVRRLNDDPAKKLRERVQKQIADSAQDAELDKLIAGN